MRLDGRLESRDNAEYSEKGDQRIPAAARSELMPLRLTQPGSLEIPQKTQNIPRRVTVGEPFVLGWELKLLRLT
jgi:hypothetical protein